MGKFSSNKKAIALNEKLGAAIKALRKKENLTQQQVAEAIGVSYQQVQKWENGRNSLNSFRLLQLSALFGLTIIIRPDGLIKFGALNPYRIKTDAPVISKK